MARLTKAGSTKAAKTTFYCSACGNEQPRWFGHCPACREWNTASEAPVAGAAKTTGVKRPGAARWAPAGVTRAAGPQPLADVRLEGAARTSTGLREMDRVLGGGIVPGSLLLVGGDPGIGKSTLLMQARARTRTGGPARAVRLG